MSTAFHPQSDGQSERSFRTLQQMLRAFVSPRQDDWAEHLPLLEFAYNNSKQASTGFTPFEMCYGRKPATPFTRALPVSNHVPAADAFIENLQSTMRLAKQAVHTAQAQMAAAANKHRSADVPYEVGDVVLLNNQNLSLHVPCPKLSRLFSGPFPVIAVDGVNVTLQLPLGRCRLGRSTLSFTSPWSSLIMGLFLMMLYLVLPLMLMMTQRSLR